MKIRKYHVTRSFDGRMIESREFNRKLEAVQWAKSAPFCRVRLQSENREIVFSKGF